jgi:hypothetical protein
VHPASQCREWAHRQKISVVWRASFWSLVQQLVVHVPQPSDLVSQSQQRVKTIAQLWLCRNASAMLFKWVNRAFVWLDIMVQLCLLATIHDALLVTLASTRKDRAI